VVEGHVTWCHACGWNLTAPTADDRPETRLSHVYDALGRRAGDRLARELMEAPTLEPRLGPAKAAAYAIAVLVHATTVALLAGGIALLVLGFPNIAATVAGVVLVGLAALMRPRLGKAPAEDVVAREAAPALAAVADEVAAALDVEPFDVLVVPEAFNASWGVVGLRRRRVLTLGLPLLTALEPRERVAVIGHELAHARNGDATRGLVVGSAVEALAEAYGLVAPGGDDEDAGTGLGIVLRPLQWIVSRPLLWLLLLELHLLLRDSQRAEYLADALAARVAGTDAMVAAHEKLLLASAVDAVAQRVSRSPGLDLFAELEAAVERVPARERERRRRVARLEHARLEETHPPTAMRIELLERRPPEPGLVVLDPQRSRAIDDELRPLRAELQRRLVEDYRDRIS
jgi:Zn-dependent protease with chaperone function